jgi:hypothetical protein
MVDNFQNFDRYTLRWRYSICRYRTVDMLSPLNSQVTHIERNSWGRGSWKWRCTEWLVNTEKFRILWKFWVSLTQNGMVCVSLCAAVSISLTRFYSTRCYGDCRIYTFWLSSFLGEVLGKPKPSYYCLGYTCFFLRLRFKVWRFFLKYLSKFLWLFYSVAFIHVQYKGVGGMLSDISSSIWGV